MAAPLPDYDRHDALGLAALVSSGEVTPTELVDAAIARIERDNPRLNAVVHTQLDRAHAEAASALPDGPFRGVPMLLKDLLADDAGEPCSQSTRDADNLPIGTQWVGRFGDAPTLLRLASQIEAPRPWLGRRPEAPA